MALSDQERAEYERILRRAKEQPQTNDFADLCEEACCVFCHAIRTATPCSEACGAEILVPLERRAAG